MNIAFYWKKLKVNQCNVCPPNKSLSCLYIKGWTMIFFKRIYTPGESFPSRLNQSRFNQPINQSIKSIRLFSYFTCNHLDKDKKIQMLVMTLRPLHNLVQKCVKKQCYNFFLISSRLPLILYSFISPLYFRSGLLLLPDLKWDLPNVMTND